MRSWHWYCYISLTIGMSPFTMEIILCCWKGKRFNKNVIATKCHSHYSLFSLFSTIVSSGPGTSLQWKHSTANPGLRCGHWPSTHSCCQVLPAGQRWVGDVDMWHRMRLFYLGTVPKRDWQTPNSRTSCIFYFFSSTAFALCVEHSPKSRHVFNLLPTF